MCVPACGAFFVFAFWVALDGSNEGENHVESRCQFNYNNLCATTVYLCIWHTHCNILWTPIISHYTSSIHIPAITFATSCSLIRENPPILSHAVHLCIYETVSLFLGNIENSQCAILKFMSTTVNIIHKTVHQTVYAFPHKKRRNQHIKMWQKLGVRMHFHHRQTAAVTSPWAHPVACD